MTPSITWLKNTIPRTARLQTSQKEQLEERQVSGHRLQSCHKVLRIVRALAPGVALALALGGAMVFLKRTLADTKPSVQLNVDHAAPREVSDTVQQAVVRDYSAAWQALDVALADNNAGALNDNFIGFAQDQLTQRIKDQQQAGLRTRIVDRGHNVEAVFYSTEGAAIELRDTATLETQILDGETVLHSERAQVRYYAIMTGAEDRWKVRVLASVPVQE